MMNPYLSWAILLVVAGGLGWYYTNGATPKPKTTVKPVVEKTESALGAKKQKRKAKKSPEPSTTAVKKTEEKPVFESKIQDADKPDEEIDRKELAKRFAAVKSGAPSVPSSNGAGNDKKNKKKTVAASQLGSGSSERSGSRVSTRASSTTGADADDDLSPAGSPVVNAVPATGYVSDMLEAPAPGASVLRLTGSMETESKKQKAQAFKPVETKKQRQQKAKNEARKLQVQEAEEQRRKLLEKQLHLAREAERRGAAKSKPTTPPNAWQTKGVTNGASKTSQTPSVELLDTFEPEVPSTQVNQDASVASGSKSFAQGLPSEEEQMRILGAANGGDEWTTVSTKKPKKKSGKADESVSEASASESQPAPSVPAPVELPKVEQVYIPDILRNREKGHPLDSDWAA